MKQPSVSVERPGLHHQRKENYVCQSPLPHQSAEGSEEGTQVRRLNGSSTDVPNHQHLHRELLLSHRRGLLLEEKPELQKVLEQRRRHREQEQALRPPSDLEQELRKRQQRLQEYEQEELKRQEGQKNVPEFVRVKEKLRHIQLSEPAD